MKYILMIVMMAACSSAPKKIVAKNCEPTAQGLFVCEELK